MTLSNGDYLVPIRGADGERIALKVGPPAAGSYVIPVCCADGELAAVALAPMRLNGQAGLTARSADGQRVGLVSPAEGPPGGSWLQ